MEQADFYVLLRIMAACGFVATLAGTIYIARNRDRLFGAGPLTSGESHSSRRYIRLGVFAVLVHLMLIFAAVALLLH